MANKVLLKRSSVAGKQPVAADLEYGELALNYTDGVLYYKDNSNTVQSISGSGGGGGATTLDGLTDVTITSVVNNDILQYDSATGEWINAPAGSVTTPLGGLSDVTISNPNESQFIYYDGTEWKNEYKYNIIPNVPFMLANGNQDYLYLVNTRDLTTLNGFLNNIVTQSYYLPFTKEDGTDVTTLVLG